MFFFVLFSNHNFELISKFGATLANQNRWFFYLNRFVHLYLFFCIHCKYVIHIHTDFFGHVFCLIKIFKRFDIPNIHNRLLMALNRNVRMTLSSIFFFFSTVNINSIDIDMVQNYLMQVYEFVFDTLYSK